MARMARGGGGNAPSKPPLHRDTVSFHPLPQEGAGAPHNQRRGGRANGILKTSRVSEPGGPRPHIPTDRTALLQLGNFTMGSKRKQQRDRCSGTVYSGALLPFDEWPTAPPVPFNFPITWMPENLAKTRCVCPCDHVESSPSGSYQVVNLILFVNNVYKKKKKKLWRLFNSTSLFYRKGNWGPELSTEFFKITQLSSDIAWESGLLALRLVFFPLYHEHLICFLYVIINYRILEAVCMRERERGREAEIETERSLQKKSHGASDTVD